MFLAVTGHRPDKLGGYSVANIAKLERFAFEQIEQRAPLFVLTGMALGWDMAVAVACVELKIEFIAIVPCDNQERKWNSEDQKRYKSLLGMAANVIKAPGGEYAAWKMLKRNEKLVDRSDELLALWDGSKGGTSHCVSYAIKTGHPWSNCWQSWLDFENVLI